jgi:hypothetical protein
VKHSIVIESICYFFFALFMYTALSKWMIYPTFVRDLQRAPFTGTHATIISIIIPAVEVAVAILVQLKRTKQLGLIGAFLLMSFFTFYVGYVLNMTTERPCSCGGIFRNMTWRNHMYFNCFSTILAAIGIWLNRKSASSQESLKNNFDPIFSERS